MDGCREAVLTRSLRKLREQVVKANLLVQEASFIAEELDKKTEYRVTLQIPAANLNANRKVTPPLNHAECAGIMATLTIASITVTDDSLPVYFRGIRVAILELRSHFMQISCR